MKTISLKIPDEIFEKVEYYRKLDGRNRTSYFLQILEDQIRKKERMAIADQLIKEVNEDRKLNKEVINDMDHLSEEGLKD